MPDDIKPQEEIGLKSLMQSQLIKYAEELSTTYQNLKKEHKLLVDSYYQTVLMGFDLISIYDEFLGGHCKRVSYYADGLAQALGMDDKARIKTKLAGLLHDIGLIGLPKDILIRLKSGTEMNEEMLEIYRQHTTVTVRPITSSPIFKDIALIIGAHHENVDGSGFPKGLRGSEIPDESKVIAIVNAYDINKQLSPADINPRRIIKKMEGDVGSKYDVRMFRVFKKQILGKDPFSSTLDVGLDELSPGQILAKSIQTENDTILLSAESVLGEEDTDRIKRFAEHTKLKMPIMVYK